MTKSNRLSYVPILAGVLVLAVAVPGTALAKGPTDARVEGPGLATPLLLDWDTDEAALGDLIDATGFWKLAEPTTITEPQRDLGQRYVVSFSVHNETGGSTPLVVHAYPFAQPDPLVYAPVGQAAFPMGEVPEGWRTALAALTTWFTTQGAGPISSGTGDADEADKADQAAAVPPADGSSGPREPITLGGLGLLAAIALAVVATRRRETAQAH